MPVTPVSSTPFVNQSTTVQYVMSQASLHTRLQNYFGVGNVSGEPGCGIANRVMQMLLQKRMAWKFNRAELSGANQMFFVTQQGVQDIRHAGACCFVLLNNQPGGGTIPTGGVGIDLAPITYNGVVYPPINGGAGGITISGNTMTIQTLDPHPFQAGNIGQSTLYIAGSTNPAYNSTFSWNALTQTSAWSGGFLITGIPDQYHIQVAATSGQTATVTRATSLIAGTATFNCINTFSVGDIIAFAGLTLNPGLNTGGSGNVPPVVLTGVTPTTISFSFSGTLNIGVETGTAGGAASGAPGIFNFGWMESASQQDINSTAFPQPVAPVEAVHRISPEYTVTGDDLQVCALIDYNNGVIKFRLTQPMGTYGFQFNIIYQARAPKLTGPTSIFQWPDDLSYVLVEMCLWQASRFAYGVADSETAKFEQSAMAAVMSALEGEDRESNTQAITPDRSLMAM